MKQIDIPSFPLSGRQLIEASAGTGKTYTIAALYVRLVLERGLLPDQILVVTFTKAATDELKGRIRLFLTQALEAIQTGDFNDLEFLKKVWEGRDRSVEDADYQRRLDMALLQFDMAAISTIHGFCERMLRQHAFDSGMVIGAELTEDEEQFVTQAAQDCWRNLVITQPEERLGLFIDSWNNPDDLYKWINNLLRLHDCKTVPEGLDSNDVDRDFTELEKQFLNKVSESREAFNKAWDQEAHLQLLNEWKDKNWFSTKLILSPEEIEEQVNALTKLLKFEEPEFLPEYPEIFSKAGLKYILDGRKTKKLDLDVYPQLSAFDDWQNQVQIYGNFFTVVVQVRVLAYCRQRVSELKSQQQKMSFDDLLVQLRQALRDNVRLAGIIRSQLPIALIDEFQDTDPVQYEIFNRVYADAKGGEGLVMIGDPKQSIYQFRGADIFAYMEAAKGVRECHTLTTNRRSTTAMVEAVNAIFDIDNPFLFEQIGFTPGTSAAASNEEPLTIDGREPESLELVYAFGQDKDGNKAGDRSQARIVADIIELLRLGQQGKAKIGDRSLQPKDIAVLVANHNQASTLRDLLSQNGVASAYVGKGSVFDSDEAKALEYLLHAIIGIENDRLLKTAFCSHLFPFDVKQLAQLFEDDVVWDAVVNRFQEYQRIWLENGFMAMFYRMIHQEKMVTTLLSGQTGERALTNLLQMGELLQQASNKTHGAESLLRWLAEQRQKGGGDVDERQLRLESDEALVKLVTIHKSKGLEFPVVFIPELEGIGVREKKNRKNDSFSGPIAYHDENFEQCLDFGMGTEDEQSRAKQNHYNEEMAEKLRLLYVAMTRSKYQCKAYFSWNSNSDKKIKHSVLRWLQAEKPEREILSANPVINNETLQNWMNRLQNKLADQVRLIPVEEMPEIEPFVPEARQSECRPASMNRVIDNIFRLASYSSLAAMVSHRQLDEEMPDRDEISGVAVDEPRQWAQELPAGAHTGNLLHQLFEDLTFGNYSPQVLSDLVADLIRRFGYEEQWRDEIIRLAEDVLSTHLCSDMQFCLNDLSAGKQFKEMEFHLPLALIKHDAFNSLLGQWVVYSRAGRELNFGVLEGYLKGFIDLVFEHNGKWYVADYKSNRLAGYDRDELGSAIRHHDYDLQYLIYTLALHRYLQQRLAGYDYETHFGGVYYLFLRGMSPGEAGSGVWSDQPSYQLIESLDRLFAEGK